MSARTPRFARSLTAVLRDPRISAGAKGLYGLLKTYVNAEGTCWPSIPLLAAQLDRTEPTVSKWIEELVTLRVISKVKGVGGESNHYLFEDEHFARFLAQEHTKENRGMHTKENDGQHTKENMGRSRSMK